MPLCAKPAQLCAKPAQRPPLADVRLVHAQRGETYEPSDDSFLLADALALESERWGEGKRGRTPRICLELGVGSGYVIASAARLIANSHRFLPSGGLRPEFADKDPASSKKKKQAALFAVDVSPAAARDASATLRAHYQGGDNDGDSSPSTIPIASVDVALADLAAPFLPRLAGAVDLLLFNPPYVLTPREEVYRPGTTQAPASSGGMIAAAWAGGDRGREVVDRALPLIARFLKKGGKKAGEEEAEESGVALVVALAENDVPDLLRLASSHGLEGEVVAERSADEERLFVLRLVLES